MNWFARWAYAPLFRMWWPLLKTLYPQPFTRFLEKHFSLTSVDHAPRLEGQEEGDPRDPREKNENRVADERMSTRIHYDGKGFARACWVRMGKNPDPKNREVISYSLQMRYENQNPYGIQAAQVVAAREGDTLVWDAADFFVPAGLWGVGIGTDFLRKLSGGLPGRPGHPEQREPTHLVVRVAADPAAGAAGKRWAANEMQLYRTAGFVEADVVNGLLQYPGRTVPFPAAWNAEQEESEGKNADPRNVQWMIARVKPNPVFDEPTA
jgi:hypothetical protein